MGQRMTKWQILYENFVKTERIIKIDSHNPKFVISLHHRLILINYDSRVQNQEFLFVAG